MGFTDARKMRKKMLTNKLKKMLQSVFNKTAKRSEPDSEFQANAWDTAAPLSSQSTQPSEKVMTDAPSPISYFHYYSDRNTSDDYSHGDKVPVDVSDIASVSEESVSYDTHEESYSLIHFNSSPPLSVRESPGQVWSAVSAYTSLKNTRKSSNAMGM